MSCLKDKWTGQWRVFVPDERDAEAKKCDQLVRIHLMEDEAVSFGFVEQRLTSRIQHRLDDQSTFHVHCRGAGLEYQQVPTLREGMTALEWLWQNRKERSSHE